MSCERGLQSFRHLPTVLPSQRGCKIRDRPIDDQKRKSIQQAPCELPISSFETRKDFSPSNDGDGKLPLHFQEMCSGTTYTVIIRMTESSVLPWRVWIRYFSRCFNNAKFAGFGHIYI